MESRYGEIDRTHEVPYIPKGYHFVECHWYGGRVIERNSDKSQFVYVPVGYLEADGTIDGKHYNKRFGRRNYYGEFLESETNQHELYMQDQSVKKYGGFYISRYYMSLNNGKLQSVKDAEPCVWDTFEDARRMAETFEDSDLIKSHLTFGAEYDSMFSWFIATNANAITENARKLWPNSSDLHQCKEMPNNNVDYFSNNIFAPIGYLDEWTQERKQHSKGIIRTSCSNFFLMDGKWPIPQRQICKKGKVMYGGFRVALWMK